MELHPDPIFHRLETPNLTVNFLPLFLITGFLINVLANDRAQSPTDKLKCGVYSFLALNQCEPTDKCKLILRPGSLSQLVFRYEAPNYWHKEVSGKWIQGNFKLVSQNHLIIEPVQDKVLWKRALPPLPPFSSDQNLKLLKEEKCIDGL
jgi:hypothetical protein